jgi:hypothetical protein
MKKKVLTETNIYFDQLPNISSVDNFKIKNFVLTNFLKSIEKNELNKNKYGDIEINTCQDITWVMDYVRDNVRLNYNFTLIPTKIFVNIHTKYETSIKRNHISYLDIPNSPDYTLMYVVEANNSEIVLEYSNHRLKENSHNIELKNKDLIMWNSDLNYYLTPNLEQDYRILLFFNFQIL